MTTVMKNLFIVLIVLTLAGLSWADPVARVQAIEGPGKLEIKTAKANWHRAHVEMDATIGDHLRTSPDTLAALRFLLGGKANLDKASEIKITSERNIKVVKIESGTFWAKFDKQKEEAIEIRTAGGVMGIRGTEFVVQVDGDETTLSLLEGEVVVEPVQGDAYVARPGSKVQFGVREQLRAVLMETEETLREAARELEDVGIDPSDLRSALRDTQKRRLLLKKSRELRQGDLETRDPRETIGESGVLLEDDIEALVAPELLKLRGTLQEVRRELRQAAVEVRKARREALQAANEVRLARREARRELIKAGLMQRGSQLEKELGLSVPTLSSHPLLEWEELTGNRFAVMILHETKDDDVHWLGYSEGKSYQYPADAKGLPNGKYRYRVIPVTANGEYLGPGLEYDFEVEDS